MLAASSSKSSLGQLWRTSAEAQLVPCVLAQARALCSLPYGREWKEADRDGPRLGWLFHRIHRSSWSSHMAVAAITLPKRQPLEPMIIRPNRSAPGSSRRVWTWTSDHYFSDWLFSVAQHSYCLDRRQLFVFQTYRVVSELQQIERYSPYLTENK